MYQVILIIHVILAIAIIGLVLIQHGKGADMGAALGAGASNTVFGSQGTGGFLFRMTGGLALMFFATSIFLSWSVATRYQTRQLPMAPEQVTVPAKGIPVPAAGESNTGS